MKLWAKFQFMKASCLNKQNQLKICIPPSHKVKHQFSSILSRAFYIPCNMHLFTRISTTFATLLIVLNAAQDIPSTLGSVSSVRLTRMAERMGTFCQKSNRGKIQVFCQTLMESPHKRLHVNNNLLRVIHISYRSNKDLLLLS